MLRNADQYAVHAYFKNALGLHWSDDFRGCLFAREEGAPVAIAVGYNAFIGRTCCMHCVITDPAAVTRAIVRETFAYPFDVCHCEAILALVDSTNAAAFSFDTKLGFRHVATVPNGGPVADLLILQMLRDECRWIRRALH